MVLRGRGAFLCFRGQAAGVTTITVVEKQLTVHVLKSYYLNVNLNHVHAQRGGGVATWHLVSFQSWYFRCGSILPRTSFKLRFHSLLSGVDPSLPFNFSLLIYLLLVFYPSLWEENNRGNRNDPCDFCHLGKKFPIPSILAGFWVPTRFFCEILPRGVARLQNEGSFGVMWPTCTSGNGQQFFDDILTSPAPGKLLSWMAAYYIWNKSLEPAQNASQT